LDTAASHFDWKHGGAFLFDERRDAGAGIGLD
jgi:hypothetical protein